MRFHKLDLNQLVVLDALLAERSVGLAAKRVYLSQPAMSNALARLRDYFEDELIVRAGSRTVLTPLADSLARPLRDVLLQIQAITTAKPSFDPASSTRKLIIEASDYAFHTFLAEVLRLASIEAPHMQFDLRILSMQSQQNLDNGDTELLLAPTFFLSSTQPCQTLFEDDFSCLVWGENEEVGQNLSLEQYMSLGHVAVQWGDGRLLSADEVFIVSQGLERRREIVAPSFTLLPRLIVGTQRIATVQTRLAAALASAYSLRLMRCPIKIPKLVEAVQWNKHQERDPAIIWFRQLMARVAAAF